MDFATTAEDEAFRSELTTWLDENLDGFLAQWPGVEDARSTGAGAAGVMKFMERRRAWQ